MAEFDHNQLKLTASPLVEGRLPEAAAENKEKQGLLEAGIDNALSLAWTRDKGAVETRREVSHYAAGMVKTAALFMPGRYGVIATAGANMLDQAKAGDTLQNQLTDAGLGAAKGLALRGAFAASNKFNFSPVAKGLTLGISNRALELGMDRNTYLDPKTGEYSMQTGLSKTLSGTFNNRALATDVIIFAGAHKLQSSLFGDLSKSPFLATLVNGGTFGMTSGAIGEINRQNALGEVDHLKVVKMALLQGTLDTLAAAPGGYMNRSLYHKEVAKQAALERKMFDTPIKDALAGPAFEQWKVLADQNPGLALKRIEKLPAEERMAATEHALKTFPSQDLSFVIRSIPPEHVPNLSKAIMEHAPEALRADLLAKMPIYRVESLPSESQPNKLIAQTFAAAEKAKGEDLSALRTWWDKMEAPTRAEVAKLLPAELIGRMIFDQSRSDFKQVGDRFVKENPALLKAIAANLADMSPTGQVGELVAALQHRSFPDAVKHALDTRKGNEPPENTLVQDAFEGLYASASGRQRKQIADTLATTLKQTPTPANDAQMSLAFSLAGRFGTQDPKLFNARVWQGVDAELANPRADYFWRAFAGREVAQLQREGYLEANAVRLPELRMPKMDLPVADQTRLQQTMERALRNPAELASMLGSGELGRLFPQVFGDYKNGGGIVGRPQTGLHDSPVHEHTLRAVNGVLANPEFAKLPEYAQTNVLWAALLHDVGKRAGVSDPGHEAASKAIAYGVLGTLGYAPEQVTRIASLIGSHAELSYHPENLRSKLAGEQEQLQELSMRLRDALAARQLRILNEADIRGIQGADRLWTNDAKAELDTLTARLQRETSQSTDHLLPVLTSKLPSGFQLVSAGNDHVFFAHTTPDLKTFFRQRSLVESPENTASVTVITPQERQLFRDADIFPLLKAPFENASHTSRESTVSGYGVGWHGHLRLSKTWASGDGQALAAEVGQKLTALGFGTDATSALAQVRQRLSQFNSVEDLHAAVGKDSALAQAHKIVVDALTKRRDGQPLEDYNESKLNNPTVAGIGILRQGRPVVFEGMSDFSKFLSGQTKPAWLSAGNTGDLSKALVVPGAIWQQAQQQALPIVVLD